MTIDIWLDASYNSRVNDMTMTATIKKAALESGLTYRQLARHSSVDIGQVSRFMSGQRTMGLPAIERICETLGLALRSTKSSPRQRRKG